MKSRGLGFAVVFTLIVSGCAAGHAARPQAVSRFEIREVGANPKTLDFAKAGGEGAVINFKLTDDASHATVYIFDLDDNLVRQIQVKDVRKGKMQFVVWDGIDGEGRRVSSGVYVYTIFADHVDGRLARYDVTDETGGVELKTWELDFNEETGEISYVLPKAALVRIRIGMKEGALLRTLHDWVPQEAGRQVVPWDFKDQDRLFTLNDHPNVQKNLLAFSLPDNSVIVRNEVSPEAAAPLIAGTGIRRPKVLGAMTPVKEFHGLHSRKICHEPRFEMDILSERRTQEGLPVIEGPTPIRVTIDPRDKAHLLNSRFEVILFCDLNFVYEEEEGTTPFTFEWHPKGLTTGEHILTASLMSFDDHIGGLSKKVWVEGS